MDDLVIPSQAAALTTTVPLRRRAAGLIRDVILGGQDGLVNVLGLVLGMAVATGDPRVVTAAGLAALLAESISMAGVAFTATGAERSLAAESRARLAEERDARLLERRTSLGQRLRGRSVATVGDVLREVELEARAWRREIDLDREALAPVRETRPLAAAVVVGVSTALGSAVPLVPFLLLPVPEAAVVALSLGAVVLAVAGATRADLAGGSRGRAALEMVGIGLVSAFAGFLIGRLLRAPG